MKKDIHIIFKFILIPILLSGLVMANIPENWDINPSDYENYMTVTAVLEINNQPSESEDIILAGFVGDECRGYTSPIMVGNQWMYFLIIYSNSNTNNEIVEFEVYDIENDIFSPASDAIAFASGIPYGVPDNPITFTTTLSDIIIGDVNFDGAINVIDIVGLVDIILTGDSWVDSNGDPLSDNQFTAADANGDLNIDVIDIVMIMDVILSENLSRSVIWYYDGNNWIFDELKGTAASSATLIYNSNYIGIRSDGDIAGIQLEVIGDFDIGQVHLPSSWEIQNKNGKIIMYSSDGSNLSGIKLFEYTGEITISEIIVADWYNSNIEVSTDLVPSDYAITNIYPNPFNPVTYINFSLAEDNDVSLVIYDLNGKIIQNLHSDFMYAGDYQFKWDARGIASGIYVVNIQAGNYYNSQKVVLLK